MSSSASTLRTANLHVSYGRVRAVRGVDLELPPGEVRVVLGANGAGKSTIIKAIMGLVRPLEGTIVYGDHRLDGLRPDRVYSRGISWVPEGREIYASLTVDENLRLSGWSMSRTTLNQKCDDLYAMFPRLGERQGNLGSALSGGEQQMLALARALVNGPSLILMDEPSLGLAPMMVDYIYGVIGEIASSGVSVLLVEQSAVHALRVANFAYLLQDGRIVDRGEAASMIDSEAVRSAYLGMRRSSEERQS